MTADEETRRQADQHGPQTLPLRLRLAAGALLWEQVWPALWPAVGVAGAFLALALFDLPPRLPGLLHLSLIVATALLVVGSVLRNVRRLRLPDRAAAQRRLEKDSGLAHRPLATLEDRIVAGAGDPGSAALWEIHRARMAAAARRLRVGMPKASLVDSDPFALRVALALVLFLGFIDAGADWGDRLGRALNPAFSLTGGGATTSLDIWLTPPDYTGLPPQFLPATTPAVPIAAPIGSSVLAQVHGGGRPPRLIVDDTSADFTRVDDSNFKGTATITAGSRLAVKQGWHTLGQWPISVVPDQPPSIAFAKPPQATDHQALRVEYKASDDYGVEGARAIIRRLGDSSGETLVVDLPLPGLHQKEVEDSSFHDLTAHPWAGLPVSIELEAKDALGQTGTSDKVEMSLPARVFHHPVARAIIDQRRELTLHPEDHDAVSEILSDLSTKPGFFGDDIVVFLGLRTAQARLAYDRTPEAIPAVQQLLWETALRIEDGRAAQGQADLRQAMKNLEDALARNAPDAEIAQLMQEVKEAMNRYLRALAENMQRQGQQPQQPLDPSHLLSPQDLQNMLDRARDLARTGDRDKARDMLAQLQELLENLHAAGTMQGSGGQGQSMQAMQKLMDRQQQLLDHSFRQSRQGAAPGGDQPGADAGDQDSLRKQLEDLAGHLGDQGNDIPEALSRAERAMREATDALKSGQPGQAIDPQSTALDALQQAARAMAQQMLGRAGDGSDGQNDHDPFGRRADSDPDANNGSADNNGGMRFGKAGRDYTLEKAREILDELRRRAGERTRPDVERDYIDRLLDRL